MLNRLLKRYSPLKTVYNNVSIAFQQSKIKKHHHYNPYFGTGDGNLFINTKEEGSFMIVDKLFENVDDDYCLANPIKAESGKSAILIDNSVANATASACLINCDYYAGVINNCLVSNNFLIVDKPTDSSTTTIAIDIAAAAASLHISDQKAEDLLDKSLINRIEENFFKIPVKENESDKSSVPIDN